LSKVNFNHIFSEVKRDTELMNLSKLLKSSKGPGQVKTSNSSNTVSSNYM
jgi:uncharacterized lipoprotein YddW (UPF0748 family)